MQLSQQTFMLLFNSGSEIQRSHFCGTCKRIENRSWYRLRSSLRNDDNRPGLTSGAAAERRKVSSKNTIDELSDAITGGRDIGLWASNKPEKYGNIGWKTKSYFLNIKFHNTEKTGTRHENAPQILFGARTTASKSLKKASFVFLLHKFVFIVSRVDRCARIWLNVRISLLE